MGNISKDIEAILSIIGKESANMLESLALFDFSEHFNIFAAKHKKQENNKNISRSAVTKPYKI